MIRINLLPVKELKAEVSRRQDLTVGVVALATMALVLVGLYLYQSYRLSQLRGELASLRSEIQALNNKVKDVANLQNKINELKSKYKVIDDLNNKKIGPVRVMESLSAATPNALWLTEFKETNGNLTIVGMAIDNQTIAEFMKALSSFAYFKNLELVETTQTDQSGAPLKRFSIKSLLSYQLPAQPLPQANAPPVPPQKEATPR
jgi:type IV pilus assembly protein PilN